MKSGLLLHCDDSTVQHREGNTEPCIIIRPGKMRESELDVWGLQCQLSYGPKFLPPSGNLIEEKGGVTKHTLNPPLISTTTNSGHASGTVHFLKIKKMCNFKNFASSIKM